MSDAPVPAVKELTDADRLDSGLKSAQQEVLETGGLTTPTTLAEAVQLSQFETWATGKKVETPAEKCPACALNCHFATLLRCF